MSNAPEIITFGCRLNAYESEAMRRMLTDAPLEREIVLVNTCAVTSEAERQVRQAIRKARREKPDAILIVTGCAAQIAPERYASMAEVDYVVGNAEKLNEETYKNLGQSAPAPIVGDVFSAPVEGWGAPAVATFAGGLTRGFVQVQTGCDHRCAYCVIPFGRGPSRSLSLDAIIRQTRSLTDNGFPEIVLSGVDIASYGKDLGSRTTLGAMARSLLDAVPDLKRLRLSSLDPAAIDKDLWDLLADEPRLMPHWHLSLQSGDDEVLRRMARRHRASDIAALCARARALRPDIAFGADLISGFPTESDAMAERTLALVRDLDITWLHVFPFSPRPKTAAAKMTPQVPMRLRRIRAARLRQAGQEAIIRHLGSLLGHSMAVHVEGPKSARAPSFAEVRLAAPAQVGSVIQVRALALEGLALRGERID